MVGDADEYFGGRTGLDSLRQVAEKSPRTEDVEFGELGGGGRGGSDEACERKEEDEGDEEQGSGSGERRYA